VAFWDTPSYTKRHYQADGLIIGFRLKPKNRWNFAASWAFIFLCLKAVKKKGKTRKNGN